MKLLRRNSIVTKEHFEEWRRRNDPGFFWFSSSTDLVGNRILLGRASLTPQGLQEKDTAKKYLTGMIDLCRKSDGTRFRQYHRK